MPTADAHLVVIGLGEDGLAGLTDDAKSVALDADVVPGAPGHLAMLPAEGRAVRQKLPSPWRTALPSVLAMALLADAYGQHGGELTRLGVEHAAPAGSFTGWTPGRAITQWSFTRR